MTYQQALATLIADPNTSLDLRDLDATRSCYTYAMVWLDTDNNNNNNESLRMSHPTELGDIAAPRDGEYCYSYSGPPHDGSHVVQGDIHPDDRATDNRGAPRRGGAMTSGVAKFGGRKLPGQEERVETGPVQFGDDWPGVFVRGDDAFAFALELSKFLDEKSVSSAIDTGTLGSLVSLLSSYKTSVTSVNIC